jgi:glutaminase
MVSSSGIPMPSTNTLNPMVNSGAMTTGPTLQSKPMELDIKQLIIQGKSYERQPLNLKNIQK